MGAQAFPTAPEAITAQWLTGVLRSAGFAGTQVASFEAAPLGEGAALAGVLVRIVPTYADPARRGPATLIGKFATGNQANLDLMAAYDLYRREVHFYNSLAHRVQARRPRCYGAAVAADGRACFLLLEDFRHHRVGDQVAGCSVADARLIVAEAARLNASFRGGPRPEGVPTYESFSTTLEGVAHAVWPAMVQRFPDLVPAGIRDMRDEYCAAIPRMREWVLGAANTVAHGDLRLDNVLLGPEGDADPVVFLDWQLPVWSVGTNDLAYLLTQSMPVADRRRHERALLAVYRDQLAAAGIDYPEDRCWLDYRLSALCSFASAVVIAGGLEASDARAHRFMGVAIERAVHAFEDLELTGLMRAGIPAPVS